MGDRAHAVEIHMFFMGLLLCDFASFFNVELPDRS